MPARRRAARATSSPPSSFNFHFFLLSSIFGTRCTGGFAEPSEQNTMRRIVAAALVWLCILGCRVSSQDAANAGVHKGKCPQQTSLRALSSMRGRRDGVCARLLDPAAVPASLNTFRLDAAAIERTPDDVTGVHVPAMDPCAPFGVLSRDLILYRHCSGLQKTRSACRPLEDASGRKIEVASNHELDQARADCKRRGLTPCAFHSQMHEDAVLFNMFFKNHRGGVYLEMGALDGRLFSNTLFFQQTLDWSGVLIEPGILLSGPMREYFMHARMSMYSVICGRASHNIRSRKACV